MESKTAIPEAIRQLLYKYNKVLVPQLGAFSKSYKPAGFDYVLGKIIPPSSSISFNSSIIVDDGVLVDFYHKENDCSIQTAREEILAFAKDIQNKLKNKEEVSWIGIGRLAMNYEQKIQFVSENQNFNTSTFGLPEVTYYPIVREMPTSAGSIKTESVRGRKTQETRRTQALHLSTSSKKALRFGLPILLAAAIILTTVWLWKGNQSNILVRHSDIQQDTITQNDDTSSGIKRKVNLGPSDVLVSEQEEDINYTIEEAEISQDKLVEDESLQEEIIVDDTPTETVEEPIVAPPAPKAIPSAVKKKVIFVGLFSKSQGVDKMTALIVDNNWIPYTEKTPKGTRVGMIVPADKNATMMLKDVKRRIEPKAFLGKR